VGKDTKTAKIIPGKTTFRSHYADSNPLWLVIKKLGRGAWLCRATEESVDWAGTEKSFLTREIVGSIQMGNLWDSLGKKHDDFYAALVDGQTIHYHNGFNSWVRCEVVNHELKPVALAGKWGDYDLPRRTRDGQVLMPYYVRMITQGETFTPNASNLFEAGCKPRDGIDPTTLPPISLAVPEMTEEDTAQAKLWKQIAAIEAACNAGGEPEAILAKIKNLATGV